MTTLATSFGKFGNQHSAHATCRCLQLSEYIVESVLPGNGDGFTADPRLGIRPTYEEDDYIVSLFGHEKQFAGLPCVTEVHGWLASRLSIVMRDGHYVGGWRDPDSGRFYVDVSIAVRGLARALAVGRINRQTSIWHLATNRTIRMANVPLEHNPNQDAA